MEWENEEIIDEKLENDWGKIEVPNWIKKWTLSLMTVFALLQSADAQSIGTLNLFKDGKAIPTVRWLGIGKEKVHLRGFGTSTLDGWFATAYGGIWISGEKLGVDYNINQWVWLTKIWEQWQYIWATLAILTKEKLQAILFAEYWNGYERYRLQANYQINDKRKVGAISHVPVWNGLILKYNPNAHISIEAEITPLQNTGNLQANGAINLSYNF